jgi:hypothetical protein
VAFDSKQGAKHSLTKLKTLIMKSKNLIGRKAIINPENDNENYDNYRGKTLIITHASNSGRGYDESCYPEMLCDFKCEDGTAFPFALYEHEFLLK